MIGDVLTFEFVAALSVAAVRCENTAIEFICGRPRPLGNFSAGAVCDFNSVAGSFLIFAVFRNAVDFKSSIGRAFTESRFIYRYIGAFNGDCILNRFGVADKGKVAAEFKRRGQIAIDKFLAAILHFVAFRSRIAGTSLLAGGAVDVKLGIVGGLILKAFR